MNTQRIEKSDLALIAVGLATVVFIALGWI